jgi:glutathione peroxidase
VIAIVTRLTGRARAASDADDVLKQTEIAMPIYDFSARLSTGEERHLADYHGKVLLVVNVASKCGFTPQYKGLQDLYRLFTPRGFEILAFPCEDRQHLTP